jgi:hypothetical protein
MSIKETLWAWWATRETRRRVLKMSLGVLLGGLAGFAYYSQVGCATGHCPITSSPWISTAYGAVFGGLIGMG